ncbi:Hypothetical predicted protein [Paramuricea clavata]|uniref:Uncharacterized protein n=1 Tax=Paramuricea clavata TaxID=317549 RepID=A0A6S7FRF6_PARCT|nr:Hypothetical predicted protein [Paramuricea clavata]
MNAVTVLVILATVGFSSAFLFDRCTNEADCVADKCCLGGKICSPKLPVHATCYLTNIHRCGCVSGSSCQVTFNYTVFGKTFYLRQCKRDDVPAENNDFEKVRRLLVRKCSTDSVAQDCGPGRCCLGGKYCAPLIPKYVPCNLEDSHKCPCASGLECRVTKQLTIPGIPGLTESITLSFKQCMPVEESSEVEDVELTEN